MPTFPVSATSSPASATLTNPVTEAKFAALKKKLRELFELDKSDLDFGIYRIMTAKNKEVTDFLDRQLKEVVRETLASHGAGAADAVNAELAEAIEQARQLGADPDSLPKVQQLKAKLDSTGGASAAELEADIYNHLLAFFSRYYDEGDFISKRRYKGDTYAIPYSGKEVMLHWANKDQYYIKSGEWHKDYRFRIGGKTVRFKLVEATQGTNNNKESDDAKRRYIIDEENPVEATNDELTLHLQFRVPTDEEKQTVKGNESTRIFGGKYARESGRTQGDEREQFCAAAEEWALQALPAKWQKIVTASSPTETKPNRTILGKHLNDFTARNTFDYFIHKNLGGFLRRELDFYIKNEVVRLDDLETLDGNHLARVQGKLIAIRWVAGQIITFLAALEDFQQKLWLKKKFVLNTNWLVTVDRIPESLRDIVTNNTEQWIEWEALGFKPANSDGDDNGNLYGGHEWGSRAYLDANDKLVVDTRFFDVGFKTNLLANSEIVLSESSIDRASTGLLVHSENYQAVRLLEARYYGQLQAVYADPPYNSDASAILYKNGYKCSAWMSLMSDRIEVASILLVDSGILSVAIDDVQMAEAKYLLENCLSQQLGTAVVRSNPQSRKAKGKLSPVHEYALFFGKPQDSIPGTLSLTEERLARYPHEDEGGRYSWMNFIRTGSNDKRSDRPKLYYPIYVSKQDELRIPKITWSSSKNEYFIEDSLRNDEMVVFPVSCKEDELIEKNWHRGHIRVQSEPGEYRVRRSDSGKVSIDFKTRIDDAAMPTTWWSNSAYASANYGASVLKDLFGANPFDFPKAVELVVDCLRSCGLNSEGDVLDLFAGSGTTGHAVTRLNREDGNHRRAILVEMGTYFHTVLKPRITKVIYSPDWKGGQAQSHDKGISALVKYFAVESYEDALNNLPAPDEAGSLLTDADDATRDALLTYALDLELGPHLLNLDAFRDPWGYCINAQTAGSDEITKQTVDLVEIFNYLIGLKVHAYGPLERYSADFTRADHDDDLGRLKVEGHLRRDPDGPFVFQRVEGELNDGQATRVLVVWRKLTDDPEQDAAVLEAWMKRHREVTSERSEYRDYQKIYINGPVTLQQPTQEIRTVYPTEETFKNEMFADTGAAS